MPEGRSRAKSPTFAIFGADVSRSFGPVDVSFKINNLTDWVQSDNPFVTDASGMGEVIDSAMIYGPLRIYLGKARGWDLAAELGLQVFWMLILYLAARGLWSRCRSRLLVQGG